MRLILSNTSLSPEKKNFRSKSYSNRLAKLLLALANFGQLKLPCNHGPHVFSPLPSRPVLSFLNQAMSSSSRNFSPHSLDSARRALPLPTLPLCPTAEVAAVCCRGRLYSLQRSQRRHSLLTLPRPPPSRHNERIGEVVPCRAQPTLARHHYTSPPDPATLWPPRRTPPLPLLW